jgi:transcriptional regulator with XRE-family HTH domain
MPTKIKFKGSHIGRNIERLRNLRGIKQETLALTLGISQSEVSAIEKAEFMEEDLLNKVAVELGITAQIIKSFDESAAIYFIDNKIDNNASNNNAQDIHKVFNPIEQVVELYERLLASEKEKIELLKKTTTQK